MERRAIGRIADDGSITRHPLPYGLRPTDIAQGGDGALWFTSNVCLGRMTTWGRVTTWRIPGTVQLGGVAAAPDGTFWLADEGADALRRRAEGSCRRGSPTSAGSAAATSRSACSSGSTSTSAG